MLEILKKIFGDKHTKDTKLLWPIVEEIKEEYEKIKDLTEDELRAKTVEFKGKIQDYTSELRNTIEEIKERLKSDEDFDRQPLYDELTEREDALNEQYEEIL